MDKRTDINTASFAYSVSLLRIESAATRQEQELKKTVLYHTAVLHGIAVLFCSTLFYHIFIITLFRMTNFCHACASAFMQVHFFICRKMSCCNIHQFD